MSKEMVAQDQGEVVPLADWMRSIPIVEDSELVAEAIAADLAGSESVAVALSRTADTVPLGALTGHTLRIVGARLMEGQAGETKGYYAVIDAIDQTGGTVHIEVVEGGIKSYTPIEIAKGEALAVTCGAKGVLAVLAVAYRTEGLPFDTVPYGVAVKSAQGRTVLKLGPVPEPF